VHIFYSHIRPFFGHIMQMIKWLYNGMRFLCLWVGVDIISFVLNTVFLPLSDTVPIM
jgi:hypothetical protein